MKLIFKAPLIGVQEENDNWILNIKMNNINISKRQYNINELKEKYGNFKFDYREPLWYDSVEGYSFTCYELTYQEEISPSNKAIDQETKIFEKCVKFIKLMNTIFGTIIGIYFGNFIEDGKEVSKYQSSVWGVYDPTIFEEFVKVNNNSNESKYFVKNIYKIAKRIESEEILKNIIEAYNQNLSISNSKISLLNIMTCLEILLENSNNELSFQISRGVSVLLPKDKIDGEEIFKKMKFLYKIRSKIVHEGKDLSDEYKEKYNHEPFEDLKIIFIECFRKYLKLNVTKEKFIGIINSSGYGDFK